MSKYNVGKDVKNVGRKKESLLVPTLALLGVFGIWALASNSDYDVRQMEAAKNIKTNTTSIIQEYKSTLKDSLADSLKTNISNRNLF